MRNQVKKSSQDQIDCIQEKFEKETDIPLMVIFRGENICSENAENLLQVLYKNEELLRNSYGEVEFRVPGLKGGWDTNISARRVGAHLPSPWYRQWHHMADKITVS